jgi:hypothetical protein
MPSMKDGASDSEEDEEDEDDDDLLSNLDSDEDDDEPADFDEDPTLLADTLGKVLAFTEKVCF